MGDEYTYSSDNSFHQRAVWRERFIVWPRRSELSGRWLFCRPVVEGIAMWTGPGDPVFEYRYHSRKEHTFWQLQR